MTQTRDFGRRIELVSMDPHFQSISIGLYRTDTERGPQFRVHSYSSKPGTAGRRGQAAGCGGDGGIAVVAVGFAYGRIGFPKMTGTPGE